MNAIFELLYRNVNIIVVLILLLEAIVIMYGFRKNRDNKWFVYLIPYFKINGRTKSTFWGYWGLVVLLEVVSVCLITDDIWAYIFTQCVMYIIIQYFVYAMFWFVRKFDEIVVYLNSTVFISWMVISIVIMLLASIDETNKVVNLCKIITLMLAVANILLMLHHLIELVTDSSYRINVTRSYYKNKMNQKNGIIKMKLEVIFIEYIVLVVQLSTIAYLFIGMSDANDWMKNGVTIETYWDCLYYTITTFLSIGHGDIIPITNLGKIVDLIISVIGVIFLGCFVGLILGNDDGDLEREKKALEIASNEEGTQKWTSKECAKAKCIFENKKRE